jgi:hypothetical protein
MATFKELQAEIREVNEANGWWVDEREFGTDMALLGTEVSEMFEAYRDAGYEDFSTLRPGYLDAGAGVVWSNEAAEAIARWHEADARAAAGAGADVDWDGFTKDELMALAKDGLSKPEGVGSAAADIVIRLLDTLERIREAGVDIDLDWEIERKLAFNRTRGYRHGGKKA